MTSKPLDTLKKGLATLQQHISAKRDALTAHLKNWQPISEADETWLAKGEGNTVDEERILDLLERAPDYEQGPWQLSLQDKLVVENLQKLATEFDQCHRRQEGSWDGLRKQSFQQEGSEQCMSSWNDLWLFADA
jgi:hypothetical protein